jgi:DNA (cytosine-5)-methyltransferase 1
MNVLDLFSGIGGFSLGLERAGFHTVAFCEVEPFCQAVLRKHWPHVPIYPDVRELTADRLRADGISVDVICGGFPCQDISIAGERAGIEAERSGLWSEFARLIGELRPRYAIVENVSNLLAGPSEQPGQWFGVILGDLATLGYDAEWHCIPASAVGAPHDRDRVWVVANTQRKRTTTRAPRKGGQGRLQNEDGVHQKRTIESRVGGDAHIVANCGSAGGARLVTSADISAAGPWGLRSQADLQHVSDAPFEPGDSWPQPLVRRVDDGVPDRVDRLHALGNAVVPQIPEIIGRAIMRSER